MCNRFKSKMQAAQIRDLMATDINVLVEAQTWEPKNDQRPTDFALMLWRNGDNELLMGTARWGFPQRSPGVLLNARIESYDTAWRAHPRGWLPVTSWIEYVKEENGTKKGKLIHHDIHLPDYSPFLLPAVWFMDGDTRKFLMTTHQAPAHLAYLCPRLPMPYALDAVSQERPEMILDQMVVTRT